MRRFVETALAFTCLLIGSPAVAEDSTCERKISVIGRAKTSHAPDYIELTLASDSKAANVGGALDASAKSIDGIGSLARELGVPPEDVRTSSVVLEAVARGTTWTLGAEKPESDAYRVSNRVKVRLVDRSRAREFVQRALANGGFRIESVELGLRDPAKAEAALLVAAGKDARARAVEIAEAAGARVGVLCGLKAIRAQPSSPASYPTGGASKYDLYESSDGARGKSKLQVPLESETIDLFSEVFADFAAQP